MTRTRTRSCSMLGALLVCCACNGTIFDPGEDTVGPRPIDDDRPPPGVPDPGPTQLRRLTHREYTRTVESLFRVDVTADVAGFPAETPRVGELENDFGGQTISTLLADRYLAAAQRVASDVVGDASRRTAVLGCDPTTDRAACVGRYVPALARVAFRTQVDAATLDRLRALEAGEADGAAGAARVIEALLQSPRFLFRPEIGIPFEGRAGVHRLTGHEVASRLAFFLWSEGPDAALLDAADAGELDTPEGVAAATERMLDDARAHEALGAFAAQWFLLGALDDLRRDPALFPEVDDALLDSMRGEVAALVEEHFFGGPGFFGIYTTDHTYVDSRLAALYGLAAPSGAGFEERAVDAGSNRGGLLTTAAVMTATTRSNQTSAIIRGAHIRTAFFCDAPPPPPPSVPMLTPEEGQSIVSAEEAHTADPVCANCHTRIDPIGHGLEMYDPIGRLRTTYESGEPVRTEGEVRELDGATAAFTGGRELGALVAGSELGRTCVPKKLLAWALGRPASARDYDAPTVEGAMEAFERSGDDLRVLLVALTTSDAFLTRRAPQP